MHHFNCLAISKPEIHVYGPSLKIIHFPKFTVKYYNTQIQCLSDEYYKYYIST